MDWTYVLIGFGLLVLAGAAVWAWSAVSRRRIGKAAKPGATAKPRSGGGVGEER